MRSKVTGVTCGAATIPFTQLILGNFETAHVGNLDRFSLRQQNKDIRRRHEPLAIAATRDGGETYG